MIHHNVPPYNRNIIHIKNGERVTPPYGVSRALRAISPQALNRKDSQIRAFMRGTLGLTLKQELVVNSLLRLWAYYGIVYPKQATLTERPTGSKPTFWRTVALLRDMNLIEVVNRYVKREQAQISNIYLLDKLVLAIARYLSEHGYHFTQRCLRPMLMMDGSTFWRLIYTTQLDFKHPQPRLDTP